MRDRIVRMLPIRDEADVLPYNLDWYAHFPTAVVDNGSTTAPTSYVRLVVVSPSRRR